MSTNPETEVPRSDGLVELERRRRITQALGDPVRVQRQHDRGQLTARERLDLLLDPGSRLEFGPFVHSGVPGEEDRTFGDGSLVGFGEIDGRAVAYTASDATVKGASGGAGSHFRAENFKRIVNKAALPFFYLSQQGGGRITDIMSSVLAGMHGASMGERNAFPFRSARFFAVLGSSYDPTSIPGNDFTVMTASGNVSLTSPAIVLEATGATVDPFELGGAEVHSKVTGQIDYVAADEEEAIASLRRFFGYVPANAWEDAPICRTGDPPSRTAPELQSLVPADQNRAYDVKKVIHNVFDKDSFFELQQEYAKNLVYGLARLDGRTVMVAANQPMHRSGVIDVPSLLKLLRAFTLCEVFNLPLITFVDVPGVMPTKDQEHQRLLTMIWEGAVQRVKLDVPKISVTMRKAYGFAPWVITDFDREWYSFAWPYAQIAFMGPEPAARVAFRRDAEASPDPEAFLKERAKEFQTGAEPWLAADLGYIDDVIEPAETRPRLAQALEVSRRRMRLGRER